MAGMSRLHLPDGWFRALFAGLESAVLSWLLAVVPGLVTYVATAAAPGLGDASWQRATSVSTAWWRTGFGGTFPAGEGGYFSLIPLGLTFATILLLRGSMRRAGVRTPGEAAFAVVGFLVPAILFTLMGGGPGREVLGLVAVAVVAGVAALWGRTRELPDKVRTWLDALPREIGRGFADGRRLGWWTIGFGVIAVLAALAISWSSVWEIHTALGPDAVSTGILGILQALYLPNLAMWALAWFAGPGFSVGSGTHFASSGVTTEALPAIPVLGALPGPTFAPGWWVALVLVALGALAGWWLGRKNEPTRDWTACATRAGMAAATLLPVMLVLSWLAGGSIGPGRMSEVGVSPFLTGLLVTLLVALGYGGAVLVRHALARRAAEAPVAAVQDDDAASAPSPAAASPEGEDADTDGEADAERPAAASPETVSPDTSEPEAPEPDDDAPASPSPAAPSPAAPTPETSATAPTAATAAVAPTAGTTATAPTAATAAVAPTAATAAVAPTAATAAVAPTAVTAAVAPTALTPADSQD